MRVLYFLLLFPFLLCKPTAAHADSDFLLNPLQTFKQQMKEVERSCAAHPDQDGCIGLKQKVRDAYQELKTRCREVPEDERCGAILPQKKSPGWKIEEYCFAHYWEKKCVVRRERSRRREKMKQKFCTLQPDNPRCTPAELRPRSGHGNVNDYCRANPARMVCKAIAEKREQRRPSGPPERNTF